MTQEPHKSNIVLIIIAIIGVIGTVIGATITVIGNYNVEKLRQETELTRIALVSIATQGGATQASMASTEILVKIQVTNSGLSEVAIYTHGEFYLTKQLEDGTIQVMEGEEYTLTLDDVEGSQSESIMIGPAKTVSMKAAIPSSYLRTLEKGEYDLFVAFRRSDNTSFVSETIPFTEEAINKYYLLADASK
jgi:hypothetical protein